MVTLNQKSLFNGDLSAELRDHHHLHVRARKPFGNPVEFDIDIACLAPTLLPKRRRGALASALAMWLMTAVAAFATYAMGAGKYLPQSLAETVAVSASLVAVASAVMFFLLSPKRVKVRTRHAGILLFTVPVPHRKRGDTELFLALLQKHVVETGTKRGLSEEQLRSGEVRTLRRLAGERVIPTRIYENAKSAIFSH